MSDELNTNEGLTRREALKKGARFGGALVWAVPVVQTVGMSPALAQRVSEGNCCLRIRFEEPTFVGFDTVGPRYKFEGKQTNCGDLRIRQTTLYVDFRVNGSGADPWFRFLTFDQGPFDPGNSGADIEEIRSFEVEVGDKLEFRAHGEFDCVEDDNNLWHTIPGGGPDTYIQYGPFVVPSP